MTRFIDKTKGMSGLTADSINDLYNFLESLIKRKQKEIHRIVNIFNKSNKDYRVVDLTEHLTIVLRKKELTLTTLNIGYPFPLYTKKTSSPRLIRKNIDLKIYLRGEILRKKQREFLINYLREEYSDTSYLEIRNQSLFRKITTEIFHLYKDDYLVYIDPYHFIGDSFVGLYFAERFKAKFNRKQIFVFSDSFKHLKIFFPSFALESEEIRGKLKENNIIIISDLIDNHIHATAEVLNSLNDKNYYIFIISRNLIINIRKDKCKIYHLNLNDILLRNKNIEDYMNDCLKPFLGNLQINQILQIKGIYKKRVFINPFSSDPLKEITTDAFLKIINQLIRNEKISVYIPRGIENEKWFLDLSKRLKGKNKLSSCIKIINDKNLADLGKKIVDLKISAALTTDTSISHILSMLCIPNITIYNEQFWDSESLQSLSAESPLGFCRYDFPQYAAILKKDQNSILSNNFITNGLETLLNNQKLKISKEVKMFIEKLQTLLELKRRGINFRQHCLLYKEYKRMVNKIESKNLNWLLKIYDPDNLLKDLRGQQNTSWIIYSSWKNLPLYKFIKFNRHRIRFV